MPTTTKQTTTATIDHIILEAADPAATERFVEEAFGLGDRVRVRAADAEPTTGFRGFTLSLVVGGPSAVEGFFASAVAAGAEVLKPVKKSFWGVGGVVQAPDGTIWKVATSKKKDDGKAARRVDDLVLLLGVEDVKASRRFYVEHGLTVAKGFGGKYVEFDGAAVKVALYGRKALAKDAGVAPEGAGAHRIAIVAGDPVRGAAFADPDGFAWE